MVAWLCHVAELESASRQRNAMLNGAPKQQDKTEEGDRKGKESD